MVFQPARLCQPCDVRGTVEVLVTRESDGRIVPVEFCLETISGQGQTLGCVSV